MTAIDDEPFDATHGWVGLATHRYYDFGPDRPKTLAQSSLLTRFLRGAGLERVEGDVQDISLQAIRFDNYIAAHVVASRGALRWVRREAARQSRLVFLLVSRGLLELEGSAPHFVGEDGGISILFPSDAPIALRARQPVELVLFSFDVTEVLPLKLTPDNVGTVLPSDGIFRSCYAYLRTAITSRTPTQRPTSAVMRGLIRETARALVAASADASQTDSLYSQAARIIDAEHTNPMLNADRLAARLGVSRSTLAREFSRHGTTIATALQRARTHTVQALLKDAPHLSADALAREAGFGSTATMRRAVHVMRAQTISELRAESARSSRM